LSLAGHVHWIARSALALGLLVLCACEAADEVAAPPEPQAAPDATLALGPPVRLAPKPAPVRRELCDVLSAILATDAEAYAAQRSSRIAADQWLGRAIVPGTERCTIEGAAWPRARYACVSHPFQADNRDGAEAKFSAMADQIDRCLNRPVWFPRAWQRGEPFQFAMGERLQAWTDQSTTPPSQVVLKLQQDLDRSGYALQLSLETVR
jgi:hypothetical protein